MKIKIENLDQLDDIILDAIDEQAIQRGLKQACFIVEAEAKKKAPKGNGDLRRSITSKVEGDTGKIFTTLEYAPYVEYGTGLFAENGNGRKDVPWVYETEDGQFFTTYGMQPQPFMRPALNNNIEKIKKAIGEALLNE